MCWRDKRHFRVDGKWGEVKRGFIHPQLFRNQPGLYYAVVTVHGAHIQGLHGKAAVSDLLIKHYGHSFWDRKVQKHELYRRLDPDGDYEHMVNEDGLELADYGSLAGT